MRHGGLFIVIVVVALVAAGCSELLPARSEGEKLYRARCSDCHGYDAAGNTPKYMGNAAADLTDDHWEHVGDQGGIGYIATHGITGACPPNPDLTDEQVRALQAWVVTLRERKL